MKVLIYPVILVGLSFSGVVRADLFVMKTLLFIILLRMVSVTTLIFKRIS